MQKLEKECIRFEENKMSEKKTKKKRTIKQ